MSDQKKDWLPAKPPAEAGADKTPQRRRLSRIVHDERGNARVQWFDVPDNAAPLADEPRVPLTIEGAEAGAPKPQATEGRSPYQSVSGTPPPGVAPKGRRDLRKLSEWIKLKRAMEKNKEKDGKD
jgi:hypothetical protein